jgi:hypothetical protein
MSQLQPFVRAFRALANTAAKEADARTAEAARFTDKGNGDAAVVSLGASLVMGSLWSALNAAATDLEQQIARDLARTGAQS